MFIARVHVDNNFAALFVSELTTLLVGHQTLVYIDYYYVRPLYSYVNIHVNLKITSDFLFPTPE